ncbi:MAG: hypothetical protein AB7V16_10290 [Vulcanibacillus sp.]
MKNNKEKKSTETSLVKYKANDLNIIFPDNEKLTDDEKKDTRNSIIKGGIVSNDGQCFMNKNEIPKQLNTDKKGSNKFYNNLENDEKFEDCNSKYADVAALIKEISNRIQDPRPQLEREKLKDSRDCLNAFIDTPQLERDRSIASDRIQKELPKLTKKKITSENISCDQLTGEEFDNDAQGHHIERKADNPRRALDLDNIVVIKEKTHKEIHKQDAENIELLKQFAEDKGWNTNNIR